MSALALTPAERRAHRAAAHHLHPFVLIGGDGLTEAVRREVDAALSAHGLIKVRVMAEDRDARQAMLADLAETLHAAPVQHIGRLLVLWRPLPPPKAEREEQRRPGPRTVKLVSFSRSGNHRATVRKVKVLGNERVTAGGRIKRTKVRATSIKKRQS